MSITEKSSGSSTIPVRDSIDHLPFRTQFTKLKWRHRLASKLLLLTVLAVLITEILIFVPFLANSRIRWLEARLDTANAVSEVISASNVTNLPADMQDVILQEAIAKAIEVREVEGDRLIAAVGNPQAIKIDQEINLDRTSEAAAIWDGFDTIINGGERNLRVYGIRSLNGKDDRLVDIIVSDSLLRKGLLNYARNILFISLMISLIAASLIYLIINEVLLRPVRHMHRNSIDFAAAPNNPEMILQPEERKDELGIAQRQISLLQSNLQQTLKEQKHLADLGLAVSKINHDMRNILASAQLMSDRLVDTKDPMVQRFAPKLVKTLSRAITYSESVLEYGRSTEAPANIRRTLLYPIIKDVQEILYLHPESGIEFRNKVPVDLEAYVDSEQLFRVLSNLCRNSVQAMQANNDTSRPKQLTISAAKINESVEISIQDTGPGLPQKAKDNLFLAFKGSARTGGTGLGLAIANELIHANGGTIDLADSQAAGTTFIITLPDTNQRTPL